MASSCRLNSSSAGLESPVDDLAVSDPTVYPCPDLGIDRIDRHGDMGHIQLCQVSDVRREVQAVGREAQEKLWKTFPDQPERVERLGGIRERVSRPAIPATVIAGLVREPAPDRGATVPESARNW